MDLMGLRGLVLVSIVMLLFFQASRASSQWVPTNGPYHGNVLCLANLGTLLFAGTLDSGIYRSKDSGANWTCVSRHIPGVTWDQQRFQVNCLCAESSRIFAGTEGRGVFLSTDSGTT